MNAVNIDRLIKLVAMAAAEAVIAETNEPTSNENGGCAENGHKDYEELDGGNLRSI
jgi:hypothetical protein